MIHGCVERDEGERETKHKYPCIYDEPNRTCESPRPTGERRGPIVAGSDPSEGRPRAAGVS